MDVLLTIHDTLLTTRRATRFHRSCFVCVCVCFFFLRWSQMLLTQCDFLRSDPNINVVRISNTRGQTAEILRHPHLRCPTRSGASHRAWCTALDLANAARKVATCITSQRLSLLSHVSVVSCVVPTLVNPRPDHPSQALPGSQRQKTSFFFLKKNLSSIAVVKHGPRSLTCMPVSQECLETRTKESTRLEPTAIEEESCGSPAKAQASARVDVPTAVFFLQCGPRRPTRVQVFV